MSAVPKAKPVDLDTWLAGLAQNRLRAMREAAQMPGYDIKVTEAVERLAAEKVLSTEHRRALKIRTKIAGRSSLLTAAEARAMLLARRERDGTPFATSLRAVRFMVQQHDADADEGFDRAGQAGMIERALAGLPRNATRKPITLALLLADALSRPAGCPCQGPCKCPTATATPLPGVDTPLPHDAPSVPAEFGLAVQTIAKHVLAAKVLPATVPLELALALVARGHGRSVGNLEALARQHSITTRTLRRHYSDLSAWHRRELAVAWRPAKTLLRWAGLVL